MGSAYTPEQVSQYLKYIEFPAKYHPENYPPRDIAFLTALKTHQISKVPYENLSLHYSKEHAISLEPQHLFQKVVGNARGRGGYCMEGSLFFHQMLKALGFDAYPVGVRIRYRVDGVPQGDYRGLSAALPLASTHDHALIRLAQPILSTSSHSPTVPAGSST